MAQWIFATERLLLYQPDATGYQFIRSCLSDADLMKQVPGAPFDERVVDLSIEWIKLHWREHEFGHYVMVEKATGTQVGVANIRWDQTDSLKRELDVGCMVLRSFQSMGIAVEGLRPLLRFGFVALEAPRILAKSRSDNRGAMRIIEKLGFRFIGKFVQKNPIIGEQSYERFELSRDEFFARERDV
jgi:RimJ/RimL family protein N-acetyltransferase